MRSKGTKNSAEKTWRFFRAGGFDQVSLDTGAELAAISRLDRKLWVALACPVDNVHFDKRTLSLIDADNDRRIRAEELIAAIEWTIARLENPDSLLTSTNGISPAHICDHADEGKKLKAACISALSALSKPETGVLTVEDTEKTEVVFRDRKFNGDGIITEGTADDETVRSLIREIIAAFGSKTDRSGKPGIDADQVTLFFNGAAQLAAWYDEAANNPAILPLGASTETAAKAFSAIRDKVDDYFVRCKMARFNGVVTDAIEQRDMMLAAVSTGMLAESDERCGSLPLARVNTDLRLPLDGACNPAWSGRLEAFIRLVATPLLGPSPSLTVEDWQRITSRLSPWFEWQQRKPAAAPGIEQERVKRLLSGNDREALMELVRRDTVDADSYAALADLEKLARFHRDLYRLCINFVNFKEFYSGKNPAVFQTGTLYIDQRSCALCMTVDDANRHGGMAAMAGAYLLYCECRRRGGTEKKTILAAVTDGDSENLMIGRNGVFYDRSGCDWDATIVKIIENPISMKQAFWLPYKNLVRMIETQVAKRATSAESASTALLEKTAVDTVAADKKTAPAPAKKIDIGTVAALGVAVGAIGTFLATLMGYATGIIRLGPLAIIGAVLGVLLLISGPSLILAYIKLRKRNLGPVLDAGGWAINAKARISVPFGAALTKCATLPPGSQRDLFDQYAEKKSVWPRLVVSAIVLWLVWVVLQHLGIIDRAGEIWGKSLRLLIDRILFHR